MEYNLILLEGLFILTPVLCQFNEVRPDVTFGDHNERFDVSDLVSYQNKFFRADGSIDYRRKHDSRRKHNLRTGFDPNDKRLFITEKSRQKIAKKVKKETDAQLNSLANIILLNMNTGRRCEVYFDIDENISNGNDLFDSNKNVKIFQKRPWDLDADDEQVQTGYRRVGTAPDLFNYAFPIDMQVNGYLVPNENK